MSTYDHTLKLKEESDKKEELKRKKNKTPVENIEEQKKFDKDAETTKPEIIKLEDKLKKSSVSFFSQGQNISELNYDLNIDRDYYKKRRRSESTEDSRKEHKSNRLFYPRNQSSALPCSNTELNNKYFLVQDENETSRESFSTAYISSRNLEDQILEREERKLSSVRLPPILPASKRKKKQIENENNL